MMIQIGQRVRTASHPISLTSARLAGLLLISLEQMLAVEPRHADALPSIPAPDSVAAGAESASPVLPGTAPAFSVGLPAPAASAEPHDAERAGRPIIVSLSDRKLILVSGGRVMRSYRVAVGARSTPSPRGRFTISTRISNPTWYHPGKVVGPGKDNPVGTRWVGLDRKGYGIHGTNDPGSIGRAASHGCIRMRNRDVEELFKLVRVGDQVEITADSESVALAQVLARPDDSAAMALYRSSGQPSQPESSAGSAQEEARLGP